MPNLLDYFRDGDGDAEAIETALCEDEVVIICCDSDDDPESVVQEFADAVSGLSCRATSDNDLEIAYKDRTVKVKLQQSPTDGDRTRWAVRDVLQPDYELRVLRSCLGADTLAFVVDEPDIWQQIDKAEPNLADELFVPFTNEVGFYVGE